MDNRAKDFILLNMLGDIGYRRLSNLLEEFKQTEAIFSAPLEDLKKVEGIGERIAKKIKSARSDIDIDRELLLIKEHDVDVITVLDGSYPEILKSTYDPPIVLYVIGNIEIVSKLSIAIVGSRRSTQYGLKAAQRIARELSAYGVTVVSGMARGIDTQAHRGAIGSGGKTAAVLGSGFSFIYPPENKSLAKEIIESGALISEFPMEMPPHKGNFPRRNRIISGLSKGVVVVEAASRSGALITADFALNEGREVFAVPGPAGHVASEGTNNLIKEGAKFTENAKDILEEFLVLDNKKDDDLVVELKDAKEKDIYSLLSDEPKAVDNMLNELSFEVRDIRAVLLQLELRGLVKQLPGKLYIKA